MTVRRGQSNDLLRPSAPLLGRLPVSCSKRNCVCGLAPRAADTVQEVIWL